MTTNSPTETTVEKWEITPEKIVDDFKTCNVQKLFRDQCVRDIKDLIRHSVQEAKAEGFREGYDKAKRESHPIHKVTGN